jgi:hypothetical protein
MFKINHIKLTIVEVGSHKSIAEEKTPHPTRIPKNPR